MRDARSRQGAWVLRWLCLLFVMGVASSLGGSSLVRPIGDLQARKIAVVAKPIVPLGLKAQPPLHLLAGWQLSSDVAAFGGISALAREGDGFVAITDAADLIRFSIDRRNRVAATIESLPNRCGLGATRPTRDAESLVRDLSGAMWIGFEHYNRICRVDPRGGVKLARPAPIQSWPKSRGAESMAQLDDGRIFVIGERRSLGRRRIAPGLIFDGDPVDPATRIRRFGYLLRDNYRATDAAVLPDGNVLVLERTHSGLLSLPGRLALLPADSIAPGKLAESRKLVTLSAPDMDQNFEAVAVSQARGRTFVWLMSDDNFLPVQQTMLLLFEYKP